MDTTRTSHNGELPELPELPLTWEQRLRYMRCDAKLFVLRILMRLADAGERIFAPKDDQAQDAEDARHLDDEYFADYYSHPDDFADLGPERDIWGGDFS